MRIRTSGLVLAVIGCLLVTLSVSCGSNVGCIGTYVAVGEATPQHAGTVIELKEEGQGVWRTQDSEVSLRWSVRGRELRLHTKEGGIIMGRVKDDTLTLTLPGERTLSFKKSKSY